MGAFLLVKNNKLEESSFNPKLSKVLNIFGEKQHLPFNGQFDLGEFTLYLYKKRFYDAQNCVQLNNGDFIASTGSFFYKGKSSSQALEKLYQDFVEGVEIENHCRGHYFMLIKIKDKLYIFRDFYGIYPVYHDIQQQVFSSSFLATALLQEKLSVAKDEFYEYFFNGFWYGEQTLLNEIVLLKPKHYFELSNNKQYRFTPEHIKLKENNFNYILHSVSETLQKHFAELASAFPNFSAGLSGGYDSRLMLAGLLKQNVVPDLFVNGVPGSVDIRCAKKIAQGLKLDLKEIHFYENYKHVRKDVYGFFLNRFYLFDGLGGGGLFDNFSDIEYSLDNPDKNKVLLNGAGGEIYRETWNISQKRFSLNAFVHARYDKYSFSDILNNYSRKEYLSNIERKRYKNLEKKTKQLNRADLENLHASRYKAIHFIMGTKQKFYPFVMPFYEPHLIEHSIRIPMKHKYYGKLNKRIIRQLYPNLTQFISNYGYSFDQKVPFKLTLKEYLILKTPLRLRPVLRKFKKSRKLPIKEFGINLLEAEYINSIFPNGISKINSYLYLENIHDDTLKSRALTLEFLFNELNL